MTSGTLGIVAGLLLWAAPAPAATVSARDEVEIDTRYGTIDWRRVEYVAAPGEANRLELTETPGHGVRLRDPAGLTTSAPCVQEDPQTVVCPPHGGRILRVALGDGDDSVSQALGLYGANTSIDAGDGNDTVEFPLAAVLGGRGDDTLTGKRVTGGPGADVIRAEELDYSDHTEGVTVDLVAGVGGQDRLVPGAASVMTGPGPDVIRAPAGGATVHSGDGDDVIEGGDGNESVHAGPGDDVIRGRGGRDFLVGDAGSDQLDAGPGNDTIYAGDGDDRLDAGPGRDELYGQGGTDLVLARDGERDTASCASGDRAREGLAGERAIIDDEDEDQWCQHVTGARRLILHGIRRVRARSARIVLSCSAARACTGRLRVDGARAALRRVRIAPGRRLGVPIRLSRAGGQVEVRVTTPRKRVLRALLVEARR